MAFEPFPVAAIGYAHSDYTSSDTTPVQSALNPEAAARIDLDDRYRDALDDLSEFSHAWLLTWLDGAAASTRPLDLRPVPFLLQRAARRVGLFATRGPRRPNSIGLSLVRIERLAPPSIFIRGVDFVDRTPVLDIKPYVAAFDTPYGEPVRCGWFDTVELPAAATPDGLRQDPHR